MLLVLDFIQVSIVFLGIIGLALAAEWLAPKLSFGFLICAAPIFLITCLFFIEHFIGLGRPTWLFVPAIALASYLVNKRGVSLLKEAGFWFFTFGFLVVFIYRMTRPDIQNAFERVADLTMITNFSYGDQLPTRDTWIPGGKVTMYYSFQYYAAGWLCRGMGLTSGVAYNLAYCVIVGLSTAGIGGGIRGLTKSNWAAAIALAGVVWGGNGTSVMMPLLVQPGYLKWGGDYTSFLLPFRQQDLRYSSWDEMFFLGVYTDPGNGRVNDLTSLGRQFFRTAPEGRLLPEEYYGHVIFLGDYHPSLCSLLFLALFILAVGIAEQAERQSLQDRACVALAVLTPFLLLTGNVWIAPLQLCAVVGWLCYRWVQGRQDKLKDLAVFFGLSLFLIFPYLNYFAPSSLNYNLTLRYTDPIIPPRYWLLLMFPSFIILLVSVISGWNHRLAIYTVIMGTCIFVFTYTFHIEDYFGGPFNTTLKWWPWAYSFVMLLGFGLGWSHPFRRMIVCTCVLVPALSYGFLLYEEWIPNIIHVGRLDGAAWLRDDEPNNYLIDYLNTLPTGILVEGVSVNDPYCSPLFTQLTKQESLGGWIDHEMIWRGTNQPDLRHIGVDKLSFYEHRLDKLPDPRKWLLDNNVSYVLWTAGDSARDDSKGKEYWADINRRISDVYAWHSFSSPDIPAGADVPQGIWVRVRH